MAEIKQYVDILLESLEKKKRILQQILKENAEQEKAVKVNGSIEEFDRIVEEKSRLIFEMENLDSGSERNCRMHATVIRKKLPVCSG